MHNRRSLLELATAQGGPRDALPNTLGPDCFALVR